GRHDLDALAEHPRPRGEDAGRHGRARVRVLALAPLAKLGDVLVLLDRPEPYRAEIAARLEIAARIPDVRDAARHAGREVAAGGAEDHRAPARHVLAAVVADAFDDRARAAVTHAEALGRAAAEERASAGRAVQRDVADQHVLLGLEAAFARRVDDQPAAGEALADVVVAVALELERVSLREERTEALPGGPAQLDVDRIRREPALAPLLHERVAQHRAHGAVRVHDRQLDPHLLAAFDRR